MISQKMIDWGSQGCGIREIAAYGEARAAVVGAENVFNFTIGNPSVKAPDCVARSIRHLLDTVPPEVLHGYTPAPGFYAVRQAMAEQLTKSFRTPYRAEDIFMTSGACAALAIICAALIGPGEEAVTLNTACMWRPWAAGWWKRHPTPRRSRSTLRRWRRRSRRGRRWCC